MNAIADEQYAAVFAGGDLNSTKDELKSYMETTDFLKVKTVDSGTRLSNKVWSCLDYFMTTAALTDPVRFDHSSRSDHAPIGTVVQIRAAACSVKKNWHLKKKVAVKDVIVALKAIDWPFRQFSKAKQTKLLMSKVKQKCWKSKTCERAEAALK